MRWSLADATDALQAAGFADVRERAFDYVLDIPASRPVLDYFDSCRSADSTEPEWREVRRNVAAAVASSIERHGSVRSRGRVGVMNARTY